MRILIVTPGYFPTTQQQGGAIEQLVDSYLNYNEKNKDQIVVYSPKISDTGYDKDIYQNTKFRNIDKTNIVFGIVKCFRKFLNKIFNRENSNAYIYFVVKDILKRKEQNYYDLIIFENGIGYINYFCKKIKTQSKIVIHLHNDYLNINTKNGIDILNNCYQIWTVSNFIKKRVEEIDPTTKKVKTLHNFLDEKIFSKKISNDEKIKLIEKLGLNDKFVFIYTGRLIADKGVKELIIAFNNMCKKVDNVKLLVVGGNSNYKNSGVFYNDLKKLANEHVVFTGYVPLSELYKYYSIADVQVVPTLCNEAFGLILLEGMYFNLPIIASNVGAIPEICGDSAFYVSKDNIIDELEKRMLLVVNNMELLNKKVKMYHNILSKYTIDNYCAAFYNLLHEES